MKKIALKKADQILNFYLFQTKIKMIFQTGINPLHKPLERGFFSSLIHNDINTVYKLYIVNLDWINSWKKYSGYNSTVSNLENIKGYKSEEEFKKEIKGICKNMALTGQITNTEENKPSPMTNDIYGTTFIHKPFFELQDLDSIVNEKTFNLFKELSGESNSSKTICISGIIVEKLIALLLRDEKKIKLIFHGRKTKNLLQLTVDFNKTLNIKPFKDLVMSNDLALCKFLRFYATLINKDSDDLIDIFINQDIEEKEEVTKCTETGEIFYTAKNETFKKDSLENKEINNINNNTEMKTNTNILKIGLKNIGLTSYMNSTLQCFCHIEKFLNIFKNNEQAKEITQKNNDSLTSSFKLLIDNLCQNNKVDSKNYYSPEEFKNKISMMNPLFKGQTEIDPKRLVTFIIMTLNKELNKPDSNNIDNDIILDQRNQQLMFNKKFMEIHKSIISDLFCGINCNIIQCGGCGTQTFNYQNYFFLGFPLEEITNFKISNQFNISNNNEISIYDCFDYGKKVNIMSEDNRLYCNHCLKTCDYSIYTMLATGSEILILFLNRKKENENTIKIDYPESINLYNYIQYNNTGTFYKLIGVIMNVKDNSKNGPFIAFCKHPFTSLWYKYEDDIVSQVNDFQNEVNNCETPCLLFYQKSNY